MDVGEPERPIAYRHSEQVAPINGYVLAAATQSCSGRYEGSCA